jgi:hypothetical protein
MFEKKPNYKQLYEMGIEVGHFYGSLRLGQMSQAQLNEIVNESEYRQNIRNTYRAACAEVSERKARKQLLDGARMCSANYPGNYFGDVVVQKLESILDEA